MTSSMTLHEQKISIKARHKWDQLPFTVTIQYSSSWISSIVNHKLKRNKEYLAAKGASSISDIEKMLN